MVHTCGRCDCIHTTDLGCAKQSSALTLNLNKVRMDLTLPSWWQEGFQFSKLWSKNHANLVLRKSKVEEVLVIGVKNVYSINKLAWYTGITLRKSWYFISNMNTINQRELYLGKVLILIKWENKTFFIILIIILSPDNPKQARKGVAPGGARTHTSCSLGKSRNHLDHQHYWLFPVLALIQELICQISET